MKIFVGQVFLPVRILTFPIKQLKIFHFSFSISHYFSFVIQFAAQGRQTGNLSGRSYQPPVAHCRLVSMKNDN